jgi:hypothetical protein
MCHWQLVCQCFRGIDTQKHWQTSDSVEKAHPVFILAEASSLLKEDLLHFLYPKK